MSRSVISNLVRAHSFCWQSAADCYCGTTLSVPSPPAFSSLWLISSIILLSSWIWSRGCCCMLGNTCEWSKQVLVREQHLRAQAFRFNLITVIFELILLCMLGNLFSYWCHCTYLEEMILLGQYFNRRASWMFYLNNPGVLIYIKKATASFLLCMQFMCVCVCVCVCVGLCDMTIYSGWTK